MHVEHQLEQWDRFIHAFVDSDQPQYRPAPERDARDRGPLSGVSFAVKDIIDVMGVPTRNGSKAFAEAGPAPRDAAVVRSLKGAGARYVGKTVTTEFAFTDPTDCRNPHDLARSPGGSSSGSGAAVAAGIVDIALGTQTAGSLCRPAAYCGVIGFKPTYGVLPTTGMTPLAPSFDTIGIIARTVDLARSGFEAMTSGPSDHAGRDHGKTRAAVALPDTDVAATPETLEALHDAAHALSQIASVLPDTALPARVRAIVADHRTVMTFEAHRAHAALLNDHRAALLQPNFRAGLQAGARVTDAQASAASARLSAAKDRFWRALADVDIVLTLPVPEGAPLIGATTGFQDWLTPWTVFGGPLICLPWGPDSLGRPRSVMLAGHPGGDGKLLEIAARLTADAPAMPLPILPQA